MAAEKFHESSTHCSFQRDDETFALTQRKSLAYIVKNLLPHDDPSMNDNVQTMEQQDYESFARECNSTDDEFVTNPELNRIIVSFHSKKHRR